MGGRILAVADVYDALASDRPYKKGWPLAEVCDLLYKQSREDFDPDVVQAFLETHPDFFLEALPLPEEFPKNETGMLTLIPGRHDTDGFFISRMRRKP